ncbi:MAG: agmatine deiminase family protein [Magnetospirillum sp.]|nr:agmatine deiminase family protein [Magnetospirillum sp.]
MIWPPASGDKERDEATREDCLGLAELLSDHAPVSLICSSQDSALVALRTPSNVAAMAAEYDASPLRRQAPLWLVDGDGRLVAALARTPLGRRMAEQAGVPVVEPPAALPIWIETDGEGTALVVADLPDMAAAENALRHWLGLEQVVWLAPPGVCYLGTGLVALPPHPANYLILEAASDARGRKLTLLELPEPRKGAGCYADCLAAGAAVVVPDFEDGRGSEAFSKVSAALPDRRVSAFPAGLLAFSEGGLGSLVAVQPRG